MPGRRACGAGDGLPHQCEHWFAMTTLRQSKDRRETGWLKERGRGTDREK